MTTRSQEGQTIGGLVLPVSPLQRIPAQRRRRRAAVALCPETGKKRFRDHDEAIVALHHAGNIRQRCEADGEPTRRHEKRAYECAMCHGWHLTSQEKRTA